MAVYRTRSRYLGQSSTHTAHDAQVCGSNSSTLTGLRGTHAADLGNVGVDLSSALKRLFDHPPGPLPFDRLRTGLAGKGKKSCLRDTLRLPALRQAQDRRRGFAPLHTPFFIALRDVVPAVARLLICTAM